MAHPQATGHVDGPSAGGWTSEDVGLRLGAVARELPALGMPGPPLEGKLLRPLVALALVPPTLRPRLDGRFWCGALALQMVHEASLLHDDILDDARERRGRATVQAQAGPGAALVLGDHYLTSAYRVAARAQAPEFLVRFIHAVERTVAGEIAQGRAAGRRVSPSEYREIIMGKSGELFGASAALSGALFDLGDIEARVALGRDLGAVYQKVDDLLDYCPAAGTGKPPLQDYRQGKWTWMMDLAGMEDFSMPEEEVLRVMHAAGTSATSPVDRAAAHLEEATDELRRRALALSPGDTLVDAVLSAWVRTAKRAAQAAVFEVAEVPA